MKTTSSFLRSAMACALTVCATAACAGHPPQPLASTPPAAQEQVDMTPWEQSAEVRELLRGTFVPQDGEPAGAIKTYLVTDEQFGMAWRRIGGGERFEGEPDFDPYQLLDQILAARWKSTVLYPTSPTAWRGVGAFLWRRYYWRPRRADLREAVSAYTRAAELLIPHGTARMGGRDFYGAASAVAAGLVALSDTPSLDDFFSKLKQTEFWERAREIYVLALGALDDPRADQMFRELLAEHPEYPWNYIEYLIDRRRYGEALQLVDQRLPFGWPRPYPETYARRGVLLERLGRLSEAEDEYRRYLENRTVWFGSYTSPLPEQYRIPGSTLQKGMTFSPGDVLPKPED